MRDPVKKVSMTFNPTFQGTLLFLKNQGAIAQSLLGKIARAYENTQVQSQDNKREDHIEEYYKRMITKFNDEINKARFSQDERKKLGYAVSDWWFMHVLWFSETRGLSQKDMEKALTTVTKVLIKNYPVQDILHEKAIFAWGMKRIPCDLIFNDLQHYHTELPDKIHYHIWGEMSITCPEGIIVHVLEEVKRFPSLTRFAQKLYKKIIRDRKHQISPTKQIAFQGKQEDMIRLLEKHGIHVTEITRNTWLSHREDGTNE